MQAARLALACEPKHPPPQPRGTAGSASMLRDPTKGPSAAALQAAAEAAAPGGVWNMGPSGGGPMGGAIMATAAKSKSKRARPMESEVEEAEATVETKQEEEEAEAEATAETTAEGSTKDKFRPWSLAADKVGGQRGGGDEGGGQRGGGDEGGGQREGGDEGGGQRGGQREAHAAVARIG